MPDIKDITAVILAGGLGSRLKPVVPDKPKVLAEVNGRPFLFFLLDQLAENGIDKVLLCTGYMADKVESCLGTQYRSLEICYSRESSPMGTGGAIRLAASLIKSEVILAMNGDSFVNTSLDAFWNSFNQKMHKAEMLLVQVNDVQRFGAVNFDDRNRITSFCEKGSKRGGGWVNGGIYLFETEQLTMIPENKPFSLEHDMFPQLIGNGLFGYCAQGDFIDIGIPETYRQAGQFFRRFSD